jgi:hypothetical protein
MSMRNSSQTKHRVHLRLLIQVLELAFSPLFISLQFIITIITIIVLTIHLMVTAETLTDERPISAVNMKLESVFRVVCYGLLRT